MEENRNVNNVPAEGNEDSINFSIHDLIQMVIGNWFWFLLSTVVCLSCALFYLRGAESLQPHGYDPHQGRQEGQRNGYRRLRRPAGSHSTPQRRQRDHRAQIAQPDDRSGTAAQPARQLRRQTRAAHREPLPPFADRRHLHRRQRAAGAGVRTDPRRQREVLAHEVRQPHLGRFRQGQGFGDLRGRDDGAVQRHDHHAVRTTPS